MFRRIVSIVCLGVCMTVGMGFGLSAVAHAAIQPDCAQVCSDVKAKVKRNSREIEVQYRQWQDRLGLKNDIVRYDSGYSAAEELLSFMSSYTRHHVVGEAAESRFLAYMMGKCFPDAYVDPTHARMSGLVNTLWAAEHLRVERQLTTCK